MDTNKLMSLIDQELETSFLTTFEHATVEQLHMAIGKAVTSLYAKRWMESRAAHAKTRHAYYLSAEYLTGRMVYNNLFATDLLKQVSDAFRARGMDVAALEDIEDEALGNGGLGRLAACFLESAATHDLPLDGYGLRYRFGLFKQKIVDGFQVETPDDWQHQGDPWSRRNQADAVEVRFSNQIVRVVPYDAPVFGYHTDNVGTLRLWQAESVTPLDFAAFDNCEFDKAEAAKNAAEDITRILYPNDNKPAGKELRLKQQYVLASASMQDILRTYKRTFGNDFSHFAEMNAIQLNDTHPVVSIPELVRLLTLEGVPFDEAVTIAQNTFSYTNHTLMAEALEKWPVPVFKSLLPEVFDVVYKINTKFCGELLHRNVNNIHELSIIQGDLIHMANLAIYGSRFVNGVAEIHSDLLKTMLFSDWYALYPDRFQNKTNGVTQRRWLGLCNYAYGKFITERIGTDEWIRDLSKIGALKDAIDDSAIDRFNEIKTDNKRRLAEYIAVHEGVAIPSDFIFDVQVKRLHEYKRQLMNAFAIMDIYYGIKDGSIQNFAPTAFIFGAKSAPGYFRAKTIIKYINEVAKLVNSDPDMKDKMRVVFVANYNCSYAEKIIPAADISEQISPAGTEASGTSNMKFMMNGAVTLGTYDGANIEIFRSAGEGNNYCFGATVEELNKLSPTYDPMTVYNKSPRVKRVVDTLVDGTFSDDGTGNFATLYKALLTDGGWSRPDQYFILYELENYVAARLAVNRDYHDRRAFARKGLLNTASSAKFSSDRTIAQYADELWFIRPISME